MAQSGYKNCTVERHNIRVLDALYAPNLAPSRLVQKCQYLFYETLSTCCSDQLREEKERKLQSLITKTKKAVRKLEKALQRI